MTPSGVVIICRPARVITGHPFPIGNQYRPDRIRNLPTFLTNPCAWAFAYELSLMSFSQTPLQADEKRANFRASDDGIRFLKKKRVQMNNFTPSFHTGKLELFGKYISSTQAECSVWFFCTGQPGFGFLVKKEPKKTNYQPSFPTGKLELLQKKNFMCTGRVLHSVFLYRPDRIWIPCKKLTLKKYSLP